MRVIPSFQFTGIGSLPFVEHLSAIDHILKFYQDIPFVPQLPQAAPLENMLAQAAAGMKFIQFDPSGQRLIFESPGMDLDTAVNDWLKRPLDDIEPADSLHRRIWREMVSRLKVEDSSEALDRDQFLKFQLCGPITLALSLNNWELGDSFQQTCEIARQIVLRRAEWELSQASGAHRVPILFLDEPALDKLRQSDLFAASGYQILDETISQLKHLSDRMIIGLHCCGQADWARVLNLDLDIVSFDAGTYPDALFSHKEALTRYIAEGKKIAWGVIPTSKTVNWNPGQSVNRWLESIKELDLRLLDVSIFTPACGTGLLSEIESQAITLELVAWVAETSQKSSFQRIQ